MRQIYASVMFVSCSCLFGCAYDNFEHFTYDASHTRQCIKDTGNSNCEPDRLSYEEYKKEREDLLNDR